MWWLRYDRDGRLLGIAIVEASSPIAARMVVALAELDAEATLVEGHELDPASASAVRPKEIGHLLSAKEAEQLINRFELARSSAKRKPSQKRK